MSLEVIEHYIWSIFLCYLLVPNQTVAGCLSFLISYLSVSYRAVFSFIAYCWYGTRERSISRVFITSKFQFDYGTLFQLAFPKPTFPNPSWKANVQKYTLPVKLNSIRKRSFTIALLDPELCCIRLLIYSCSNLSEMSDFST